MRFGSILKSKLASVISYQKSRLLVTEKGTFYLWIGLFSLIVASLFLYPVWFTQDISAIDAWIYWGAGNNPQLSYMNNNGDLYYLQRYVMIGPQIVFHFLFGPLYSQLALGIFWLTIAAVFAFKLGKLFINQNLVVLLIIFAFSSRGVFISFGSSLHHGPTIALTFGILFLLTKGSGRDKNSASKRQMMMIGGVFALVANNYLIIALYLSLPIVLVLLFDSERKYAKSNRDKLDKFRLVGRTLGTKITCAAVGFISVSFVFEVIHQLVSQASKPILLQQIRMGSNLIRSKNPWNGDGFNSFWSKQILSPDSTPWLLFILCVLLTFFLLKGKDITSNRLRIASVGVIASMALTTIGYSNPIKHSFTACIVIPLYFASLIVCVKSLMDFFSESGLVKLLLSAITVKLLFQFVWAGTFASVYSRYEQLLRISFLILFCGFVIFLLSRMNLGKPDRPSRIKKYAAFLFFITSLYVSIPHSVYEYYFGQPPTFTSYQNAQKFYGEVSIMRENIFAEATSTSPKARVWLTPEDENALISSQLYAYNLISFKKGQEDCSQVSWALSSENPKLMSFYVGNFSVNSLDSYLAPCNARSEGVRLVSKRIHPFDGELQYVVANIVKNE